MLFYIGIDPGVHIGFCVLEYKDEAFHYIESSSNSIDDYFGWFEKLYDKYDDATICIEQPACGRPQALHNMLNVAEQAGIWFGIATCFGCDSYLEKATSWRKKLIGNRTASDKDIKTFVYKNIVGFPAQSNSHVRDAACLAMFAKFVKDSQ